MRKAASAVVLSVAVLACATLRNALTFESPQIELQEINVTGNLALCRALRSDPVISRATPIILTTAGPALRAQQLEALRAGAWELRGDPLDVEELVLRLGVYVQGKLEVDRLGA